MQVSVTPDVCVACGHRAWIQIRFVGHGCGSKSGWLMVDGRSRVGFCGSQATKDGVILLGSVILVTLGSCICGRHGLVRQRRGRKDACVNTATERPNLKAEAAPKSAFKCGSESSKVAEPWAHKSSLQFEAVIMPTSRGKSSGSLHRGSLSFVLGTKEAPMFITDNRLP